MKHAIIIAVILVVFSSISGLCGELDDFLKLNHFTEHPTPGYWSSEANELNHCKETYYVKHVDNEVIISSDKTDYRGCVVNAGAIKYVGSNVGEFGGNLKAVFRNGFERVLINDCVVAMIPYEPEQETTPIKGDLLRQKSSGLYVFTGLAHMTSRRGAIYFIENYKTDPTAKLITLLPDAPEQVIPDKYTDGKLHKFIIVGSESLITYAPERNEFGVGLIRQFWAGLYPNSALIMDGHVLIGIRSGVITVKLYPSDYMKVRFYRKNHGNNEETSKEQ